MTRDTIQVKISGEKDGKSKEEELSPSTRSLNRHKDNAVEHPKLGGFPA